MAVDRTRTRRLFRLRRSVAIALFITLLVVLLGIVTLGRLRKNIVQLSNLFIDAYTIHCALTYCPLAPTKNTVQ